MLERAFVVYSAGLETFEGKQFLNRLLIPLAYVTHCTYSSAHDIE